MYYIFLFSILCFFSNIFSMTPFPSSLFSSESVQDFYESSLQSILSTGINAENIDTLLNVAHYRDYTFTSNQKRRCIPLLVAKACEQKTIDKIITYLSSLSKYQQGTLVYEVLEKLLSNSSLSLKNRISLGLIWLIRNYNESSPYYENVASLVIKEFMKINNYKDYIAIMSIIEHKNFPFDIYAFLLVHILSLREIKTCESHFHIRLSYPRIDQIIALKMLYEFDKLHKAPLLEVPDILVFKALSQRIRIAKGKENHSMLTVLKSFNAKYKHLES